MLAYIGGDITQKNTINFNAPDKTIVLLGNLRCENNIQFKVQNLVILGDIFAKGTLSIYAKNYLILLGRKIRVANYSNVAINGIYMNWKETTLHRIRELGIDVIQTDSGVKAINVPEDEISY